MLKPTLPKTPYCPDLAMSDFHLFLSLEKHFGGRRIDKDEEVRIEVNDYLEKKLAESMRSKWWRVNNIKKKRDKTWFDVNTDEMKAFFALCIIMSQVKKPWVQMNWSKRALIHTPIFGETMPFRRFLGISRFLHFTNNEKVDGNDRIKKIYVGQNKTSVGDVPAFESVVMEMAQPLLGKGYTLYLNNWYSYPILYLTLLKNDTNVVGTVRKNRKNMPKKLASMALKKGEVHTLSSRSLLALRWRDKKDVYMLSTKHSNA
ncbi:hypothetical protein J437_LFUL016170 [Ladona fulva]|uniref:PiggyBac transposable element-derived protein domain-containing protein n=1 Tax=Ladona fulva TaxID=123851 RepID=A0A8K0KN20_LADFU|nr:hypothetical protein J437_LFUL016170 [Ladona fulva]